MSVLRKTQSLGRLGRGSSELLCDLLMTTKDGDWGETSHRDGLLPYRVIRGADFPSVKLGKLSGVPIRYLDSNTVRRRTLLPEDIIIETAGGNRDRPTGRTLLIKERLLRCFDLPVTCASFCRFLRVDPKKANPAYVYWYLQYLYQRGEMWEHQVQHTGVARFQYTRFAETIRIPLPENQSEIARTLTALDDKIELNRRMNETLEAVARASFAEMFHESAESDSAEIPFREIADIRREGLNPGEHPQEVFEHYSIPAFDELQLPTRETGDQIKSNKFIVDPDSVLLSKLNPRIPRVWLPALAADHRSICSTEFLVLRPKAKWSREYIYGLCNAAAFQEVFATMVTGTSGSHQRVKPEYLEQIAVVRPDVKLVGKFTTLVKPLHARVAHNLRENSALAALRDTLLPKLISAEIPIEGAETTVGAAV